MSPAHYYRDEQEIAAQIRALQRQGGSLGADRDSAYDALEDLHELIGDMARIIKHKTEEANDLKRQLERCRVHVGRLRQTLKKRDEQDL